MSQNQKLSSAFRHFQNHPILGNGIVPGGVNTSSNFLEKYAKFKRRINKNKRGSGELESDGQYGSEDEDESESDEEQNQGQRGTLRERRGKRAQRRNREDNISDENYSGGR